jgi:tripartite-type tricarboxylate transporter receptor subunit TctC
MKTRVTKKLVFLSLAVAFTLAGALAASAQPGEFVKGVLQPLADGFPNQPITLIVVDEPGSYDAIYAQTFGQALKSISPVDIRSSVEPALTAGTFYTIKDVLTREGGADGYYLVINTVFSSPLDLLTEPIEEEAGLDASDLNEVVVTETIPFFAYQRKNTPWGPTLAGLVKYANANPGKVKYISSGVGSGNDICAEWYMRQLGIRDKIIKIPQPGNQAAITAIAAGEGDFGNSSMSRLQPHYEGGRVDPILVMSAAVPPPFDKDPNVVSLKQAGLPLLPMGNIIGLATPKQVPKAHTDWLYKLFKAGFETDLYKERAKRTLSLQLTLMDGETANALKYKYLETFDPILRSIGLHKDQQQKKK